jgi:hypothetical protein
MSWLPVDRPAAGNGAGAGLIGLRERAPLAGWRAHRRGRDRRRPLPAFGLAALGGPMTIRVLLVDDDALVRSGLRLMLRSAPDIDVVGEAADGAAAITARRNWYRTWC